MFMSLTQAFSCGGHKVQCSWFHHKPPFTKLSWPCGTVSNLWNESRLVNVERGDKYYDKSFVCKQSPWVHVYWGWHPEMGMLTTSSPGLRSEINKLLQEKWQITLDGLSAVCLSPLSSLSILRWMRTLQPGAERDMRVVTENLTRSTFCPWMCTPFLPTPSTHTHTPFL